MAYLLGIDIGTSGTKTCLFAYDGTLITSSLSDYPLFQPKIGWAEQRPEDWWSAVRYTIKDVLFKSGVPAQDITGIGLSGQMHGLVLLGKNGEVLRPSIIWCDQRTEEQSKKLEEQLGLEKIIQYTANPPLVNFTATKLLWVKEKEPQIYEQIGKVLLPKDYIRYKLTGEFATEVSDASGTLFLDVSARKWSEEMLHALGIDKDWLPKVYESYEVSGCIQAKVAEDTGLREGTPVVGGGGDQAAGAVGNGIVNTGIGSATLGTSGVIFASTDELSTDRQGRLHSFCHAVPGKWHVMGVTQAAGGSLQWFRNQFGQLEKDLGQTLNTDPYELFSLQAAQVGEGSEGLIFLPYLMGERTPHLDSAAKGVFFGISSRHTKNHFVRAIMEGVAFSLQDGISLLSDLGIETSEIRASGGGAKSAVWRQILTDVFNQNVVTIEANEGPAFGAALLAGVGTKVYGSVEEACRQTIRLSSRLKPIEAHVKTYGKYYQVYKKLYLDLKQEFRLLNDLLNENKN